ncbi:MAG: GNVR domain-containing protein [Clostridia bacterium]|nr:GNVR domain-containing protein [Clostridia bacterium]
MELSKLLKLIDKYKIFILTACLVTALVASWISLQNVKNVYQTSSVMIICDTSNNSTNSSLSYSNFTLNVNLVNSYRVLCKTNRILDKVLQKTGLKLTTAQLASKITVASESETDLIRVTAADNDPQTAALIANTVAQVFESEIPDIMKMDNVQIIDSAPMPTAPSSPNRVFIVLMSVIICLVACAAFIALREALDFTITSEGQLEEILGCPVLASMPHTKNSIY